jgi:lactoylglutathione lyase
MGTQINMIGVFVTDLQTMVAFYRDVLGFGSTLDGANIKHLLPMVAVSSGAPPCGSMHPEEGVRFSMFERAHLPKILGQTPAYPDGVNGTFELAVDLPTSADADREFERMTTAGAKEIYPPRDEPWGMHSAMIADPEGNLIEIGSWNRDV